MENLIFKYLAASKYDQKQSDEFKENYYSHPNYPSLYSITDALELIGIETVTANLPKYHLPNLPEIFMASTYLDDQTKFVLVRQKGDIIVYETGNGTEKSVSYKEFGDIWDGLVLVIEANENPSKIQDSKQKLLLAVGSSCLLLVLLSVISQGFEMLPFFFQLASMIGIGLGIFILQEEFGNPNSLVAKVCSNTNSSGLSCSSVITSEKAKLPLGFSFSDLPLLFFGLNFLLVSFHYKFYAVAGLCSLVALPVVAYSIYLQKYSIKKWCLLCLAASCLVMFQAILYGADWNGIELRSIITYLLVLIVAFILWSQLKKTIRSENQLSSEQNALRRFKRNFQIFELLLGQGNVTSAAHLRGVSIGPVDAPVVMELFLSPTCGYCYKVYLEAIELFEKQQHRMQLRLYFNLNMENKDNPYLNMAENAIRLDRIEPFNDWYIHKLSLEEWKEKWQATSENAYAIDTISEHFEYCEENGLHYAPVVLVNGKLYPKEYAVSELKYFIGELEEKKEYALA